MDPRPYNFEYRRPRPANQTYQSPKFYESIYQYPAIKQLYQTRESRKRQQQYYKNASHIVQPTYISRSPEALNKQRQGNELLYNRMRQIDPNVHKLMGSTRQVPPNDSSHLPNGYDIEPRMKMSDYEYNIMPRSNSMDNNSRRPDFEQEPREQHIRRQNETPRSFSNEKYSQPTSTNSNRFHGGQTSYQSNYMSTYGDRLMRPMPSKGDQDRIYEYQQKAFNIISGFPNQNPIKHRKYPRLTLQDKMIESGQYFPDRMYSNPEHT